MKPAPTVGRQQEINLLCIAAIAKESICLLGRPGIAKSLIVDSFAKTIGLRYFRILLSDTTEPESVFGPISPDAYKKGRYEHAIDNYLPSAEIALLDEIWKSNPAVYNGLLTILMERMFQNNGTWIKCPLQTFIGASNEYPEDTSAAIWDRFTMRLEIDPVDRELLFDYMFSTPQYDRFPIVSRRHLNLLQLLAQKMPISPDVHNAYKEICDGLAALNIDPSDRRWVKSISIVKAYAALQRSKQVKRCHVSVLQHVLWDSPDQRADVKAVIDAVAVKNADDPESMLRELEMLADQAASGNGRFDPEAASIRSNEILTSLQAMKVPPETMQDAMHYIRSITESSSKLMNVPAGVK